MSNTIQHINKGKAVVVHLGAGWGERLRFTLERHATSWLALVFVAAILRHDPQGGDKPTRGIMAICLVAS